MSSVTNSKRHIYTNAHEPTSTTLHEFEDDHEVQKLTEELRRLDEEEKWLDETIFSVENQLNEMSKDPLYEQFAYVTYEDIKKLSDNKENSNSTLLAIRAPKGTTLEIPERIEAKKQTDSKDNFDVNRSDQLRNQIFIRSQKDEIMVYMINNSNDQNLDIKEEEELDEENKDDNMDNSQSLL